MTPETAASSAASRISAISVPGHVPLEAASADLAVAVDQPGHGADRAVIHALVEKGCVDLGCGPRLRRVRLWSAKRGAIGISSISWRWVSFSASVGVGRGRGSPPTRAAERAGDAWWQATPPAPRRSRRASRWSARVPRLLRSRRVGAGRQRDAQQVRNFWIVLFQESELGGERVRPIDLPTTSGGCQRAESAGLSLTASLAEGRGVVTFATQDRG